MPILISAQILLLWCSLSLWAQSIGIQGSVAGAKGVVLRGEILLTAADDNSVLLLSEFSDNVFQLQHLLPRRMNLRISVEGYADTLITLPASTTSINLGTITLTRLYQASEVAVEARQPFFEQVEGGTRLRVDNTMLSTGNSTSELLSKVPKLSVSGNKLTVFGSGDALLYVDGEQVMMERINSLPVNQVYAVDILTNPSARYDAGGRAVVNIILKHSDERGLLCVLNQNFTAARHLISYSSIGLNYRAKALSISADYSLNLGTDWTDNIYSTEYNLPSGKSLTSGRSTENTKLANVSSYRVGVGYVLSKNSSVSLQYDGMYNLYQLGVSTNSVVSRGDSNRTTIAVFNNGQTKNINNSINANYNLTLDTLGSHLFAALQYNNFTSGLYDQIAEDISDVTLLSSTAKQALRVNDGTNGISLWTAQADASKIFAGGSHLDVGLKVYDIVNESRITFRTKTPAESEWTYLDQYANSFRYRESVPAAYAQYFGSLSDALSFSLGARADFSSVQGFSNKVGKSIIDTSYLNFYPNAKLSYTASDDWKLSLSYSRRINRPLYQDIDPFLWYVDSLTSVQGNSKLIPEMTHSFEATVAYTTYSLKLAYATAANALRSNIKTGVAGENSIVYYRENMESFKQYTVSLDLPFESAVFSSYNTAACTFNELRDARIPPNASTVTPQIYLYTLNQIRLENIATVELSGEYYSPFNDGITERQHRFIATVALSRSFFDDKLNLQLLYNDVAAQQRFQGSKTVGVITSNFNQRGNSHFVRLAISYNFGTLSEVKYKNKSVNDTEYNRIKQ